MPIGNGMGPVAKFSEESLILHELNKKKRHIPIRQLLARAGQALQALKPCFMMGPLSVSQYLEPGMLKFDLIIMDEASQLKPEEALGAISRGKQLVVVGDPKQLPPTSFFDKLAGDGSSEDEENEAAIDEAESILDVCQFIFQPVRRLRWHYRSQHHSLIAFSNRHFYRERPLVVFPSPHGPAHGLGVRYHYLPNAVYENRRNRAEAVRVADAVIEHFQQSPSESLGVVTLNLPQRDLIVEEVDRRTKMYPQALEYLNDWRDKGYPFFIKNLENVQGDERDAIYISTTFGRNPQGVLFMKFGPINGEKGWRRLNVLFTRARRRVELFTSMDPAEMRIEPNTPRGVKALKDYLEYAKRGELEAPEFSKREPDSDFEIAVAEVIRNKNYDVVPQLGVAGFFIDIAVRNPDHPGEFIAGIECDGATYHSSLSARDRDRLRQQILERLGWKGKMYRIWSTDWFKDPRTQIRKLLEFLDKARQQLAGKVATVKTPPPTSRPWQQIALPQPAVELPPKAAEEGLLVQVGDHVTYCFLDNPKKHFSVQIVDGKGNPNEGIIGENAPLAQALLDTEEGQEVDVHLPLKTETLRIIKIHR